MPASVQTAQSQSLHGAASSTSRYVSLRSRFVVVERSYSRSAATTASTSVSSRSNAATARARALEPRASGLVDLASSDAALELRVAFDLRNTQRDPGTVERVVVVAVVLERLPERRGAVEARHAVGRELRDRLAARDAQRWSPRLARTRTSSIAFEHGEDLVGLLRDHAADRDALVSDLLELLRPMSA